MSVRALGARFFGGFTLEGAFAHPDDTVDFTTLLHEQPFGHDVAVHHAGGLDLDPLVGADAAAHFTADDRLARDHVALDLTTLPHQHLTGGADRADHGAFDL